MAPIDTNKLLVLFNYDNFKNKLYVGQFGAQLIKLNFIINSVDIYEPHIDDKGIDFIARVNDKNLFEVQVKTVRLKKDSYTFIPKHIWNNELRKNMYVAFVVLQQGISPTLLLIPAIAWKTDLTNKIFSDRNYEGKKSKPEWGITLNPKNLLYLSDKYDFDKTLDKMMK